MKILFYLILFFALLVAGCSGEKKENFEESSQFGGELQVCEDSKELSKVNGISIKCVSNNDVLGEAGIYTDTDNNVIAFTMLASPLPDIFLSSDHDGYWYKGFNNFPKRNFTIEIKNLPMSHPELRKLLFRGIEDTFNVDISIGDYPWDGYKVIFPNKRPNDFLPPEGNSRRSGTIEKGYYFKYSTVKDLQRWLKQSLQKPVEVIYKNDYGKFDFSLQYKMFDRDDLIDKLNKIGIKVIKEKINRKTVLIEKK